MCGSIRPQIHDRVANPQARSAILRFRAAMQQVEREVPGLVNVFISEVVDSVEVSGPIRRPADSTPEGIAKGQSKR